MTELAVEVRILVVRRLEDAVDDAEGVGVVFAERVAGDLRDPAVEVLAVEELNPVLLVGRRLAGGEHADERQDGQD